MTPRHPQRQRSEAELVAQLEAAGAQTINPVPTFQMDGREFDVAPMEEIRLINTIILYLCYKANHGDTIAAGLLEAHRMGFQDFNGQPYFSPNPTKRAPVVELPDLPGNERKRFAPVFNKTGKEIIGYIPLEDFFPEGADLDAIYWGPSIAKTGARMLEIGSIEQGQQGEIPEDPSPPGYPLLRPNAPLRCHKCGYKVASGYVQGDTCPMLILPQQCDGRLQPYDSADASDEYLKKPPLGDSENSWGKWNGSNQTISPKQDIGVDATGSGDLGEPHTHAPDPARAGRSDRTATGCMLDSE